ncbi:MAG TPA: hypothetical protein VEL69_08940 [Ktedonobacteraceae bacterium]|nr:hypothetical protein [Ktedonobacteraceae bacterium]
MSKDRFERKAYRRSPGRQYGYDYDPLRAQGQGGSSQSGRGGASQSDDQWSSDSGTGNTPSGPLAPRPNPRRTRQLLRQSIIASKYRSTTLPEEDVEQDYDELDVPQYTNEELQSYEEDEDSTLYGNRYRARNGEIPLADPRRSYQLPASASQRYIETGGDEEAGEWNEFDFVDPDIGYEDPLDRRVELAPRSPGSARRLPERRREVPEEFDEYEYEEEIYERPARARRRSKKRGITRRKLLVGLGVAAVGGVALYELGPKIPQALNDATANVERQIEDAYNKGLAAGAAAVRKEFITALDNLEGVSLGGAINAAKLTRLAYDAFVTPLITLAATVTGDFLNVTLRALVLGRGWLARINQDNDTLAALQTVLQSWVKQVKEVPKEWQTIADTDLDAAQSYLRALQRKIQAEQAKLDAPPTTGTPTSHPNPAPTPKR